MRRAERLFYMYQDWHMVEAECEWISWADFHGDAWKMRVAFRQAIGNYWSLAWIFEWARNGVLKNTVFENIICEHVIVSRVQAAKEIIWCLKGIDSFIIFLNYKAT